MLGSRLHEGYKDTLRRATARQFTILPSERPLIGRCLVKRVTALSLIGSQGVGVVWCGGPRDHERFFCPQMDGLVAGQQPGLSSWDMEGGEGKREIIYLLAYLGLVGVSATSFWYLLVEEQVYAIPGSAHIRKRDQGRNQGDQGLHCSARLSVI